MKKIISKLMGGVFLFSLSMSLTSCEGALDDILGEWSRPTPGSSTGGAVTSIDLDADEMKLAAGDKGQLTAKVDPAGTAVTWSSDQEAIATVDANGLVTAKADGTATITATAGDKSATCTVTVTEVYTAKDYKEGSWDVTNKKVVFTKQTAPSDPTPLTNSVTSWSGWYTVSGDVTIDGNVTLTADANLILQDGAKLTITGKLYGGSNNLYIYGQSEMTGELVVNCTDDAISKITTLEVHSCQVKATTSSNNAAGFIAIEDIYVYGGSVDAENTGSADGYGILLASSGSMNTMNIYGGDVKAVGKGSKYGITAGSSSTVTVYGGKLWAECAGNKAIDFNYITLTKDTGYTSGKIEYSSDKTDWSETKNTNAKYVRVGY